MNKKDAIQQKFENDDLVNALRMINDMEPHEIDDELFELKNKLEVMTTHLHSKDTYRAFYDEAAEESHGLKWHTFKEKRKSIKKILKNILTKYYRKKAREDYRYETFESFFSSIKPHIKSVLDIGCHDAAFIKLFGEMNQDITFCGIEISEKIVHYAKKNAPVRNVLIRQGSAEDAPIIFNQKFDLVLVWEILEHVPDHIAIIKAAEKMLTPSGYMCITVPFNSRQSTRLTDRPVEHIREFTYESITNDLGDKPHLKIEEIINQGKSNTGYITGSYFITYRNPL
jgi:2-polyprenyl-3-methyl-5-hydroxy-6-metoxy-1,4-benzoquinol methylase